MKSYLIIALIILALVPILATQALAENCTITCSSLGYNCGYWTICGETVNCGGCAHDQSCDSGVCEDDCESHDEKRCYNDDVYWYDSCGHRESRYKSCDEDCSDGRCVSDHYDDNYYYDYGYYDSSYYNSRYGRCQPFCNYQSLCSQAANDGCGDICHRITEGLSCGSNGQCSDGVCMYPKSTPQQQVVVQQLPSYQVETPQPAYHGQQPGTGSEALFIIIILSLGCVLILFMVFFLLMKLLK
jgi:hypothetical protein